MLSIWLEHLGIRLIYIQVLILTVGVHLARLRICGQVNNAVGSW